MWCTEDFRRRRCEWLLKTWRGSVGGPAGGDGDAGFRSRGGGLPAWWYDLAEGRPVLCRAVGTRSAMESRPPVTGLVYPAVAVALAYALALAVPFVRRGGRGGWVVGCLAAGVFACPLVIPAHRVVERALAMFVCGDLFFRVVDYDGRCRRTGRRFEAGEYRRFLVPFPVLLVVFAERRRLVRAVPAGSEVLRVVLGGAAMGAGFLALGYLAGHPLSGVGPAVAYVLKLALYAVAIEGASRVMFGVERLAGWDTRPLVRNMVLSRTVAEFWRRYNHRVHDWLLWNVYRPAGGRRSPAWGVFAVFLVSGVFHELAFGIATSRMDGSQLLFFLLQVPGVWASGPLERLARRGVAGKVLAHGTTAVWMVGTTPLFIRALGRVFPALGLVTWWG